MRLALVVGRLDFWNIGRDHQDRDLTPYEMLIWRAYEIVEPFGERRADLRMAAQTLNLLQAQSTRRFTEDETESIVHALLNYWNPSQPEAQEQTPEEAAKQAKLLFSRIGQ